MMQGGIYQPIFNIYFFSWEEMQWNVTGNVLTSTTDVVEVCHK